MSLEKFDRNMVLLRILKGSRDGIPIDVMVSKLGVSKRTVYRYLKSLSQSGFDIIQNTDQNKIRIFSLRKIDGEKKDLYELFPEIVSKQPSRHEQVGKNIIQLKTMFCVEEIETGKLYFFTDVRAISNHFPSLKRWPLYRRCSMSGDSFIYNNFKIHRGPLFKPIEKTKRYER